MKSLKEKLLMRIQSGEIPMRPRVHFILISSLAVGAILLLVLSAIYLFSLAFFGLDARGAFLMSAFGPRGFWELLVALPLSLLAIGICMLAVSEILARRFAFTYRRPVLYSLAMLLVLVGAGSGLFYASDAHELLREQAEQGPMTSLRSVYRTFVTDPLPRGYPGTVLATTTNGFLLQTLEDETVEVIVTPQTRMPRGDVMIGTEVFVGGERDDDTVEAFGVRPLDVGHPIHLRCKRSPDNPVSCDGAPRNQSRNNMPDRMRPPIPDTF